MLRKYFERGFSVIPVVGKFPAPGVSGFNEWVEQQQPEEILEKYEKITNATGWALVTSWKTVVALDIDSVSKDILDACPRSPCVKVGRRGETRFFRAGPEFNQKRKLMRPNTGDPESGKDKEGVEILCNGAYTVMPPSIHPDTGAPYYWSGASPLDTIDIEELPELTLADISVIETAVGGAAGASAAVTLAGTFSHSDATRCPHGSHDRLKALACGFIAGGKPIDDAVRGLVDYDGKHHKPIGYFSDKSRSECKSDPYSNAAKFYSNLLASVNRDRSRRGEAPQVPSFGPGGVTLEITPGAAQPIEISEIEDWDNETIGRFDLWQRLGLETGERGPSSNLASMIRIVSRKPKFAKGIWYDSFHGDILTTFGGDGSVVPWSDAHTIKMQEYAQGAVGLKTMSKTSAADAVLAHARSNERNEVKEWLQSLPHHDGLFRLGTFFAAHLGAENTEYNSIVGENFFTSLVARIMAPGCKVDNMVILEGPQGTLKSSALKAIVGAKWFGEATEEIGTKDFMMSLRGKWLIEIPELDAMVKAEPETIKRVLSTQSDRLRVPYGKSMETFPRQCVFAGTTNANDYLKDQTGGRRFWPVRCGEILIEQIIKDREQLFAEALTRFHDGESWWEVPTESAKNTVEARTERDPWVAPIEEWLSNPHNLLEKVTSYRILSECLKLENSQIHKGNQRRVATILHGVGWENAKTSKVRYFIKRVASCE